jgi:hypothetical protein
VPNTLDFNNTSMYNHLNVQTYHNSAMTKSGRNKN